MIELSEGIHIAVGQKVGMGLPSGNPVRAVILSVSDQRSVLAIAARITHGGDPPFREQGKQGGQRMRRYMHASAGVKGPVDPIISSG